MSGPQFIHVETYAMSVSKLRREREIARAEVGKAMDRKLSVEEICAEAARLPGSCPHVDEVRSPVLLFGTSPDQVVGLLHERVAEANAAIKAKKKAMARGTRATGPRAIRSDTHTLMTMVASHPIPWADEATGSSNYDCAENKALLINWERENIVWGKVKAAAYGLELVSVVRHEDETYPHLHFLFIPLNERVEARASHPGYSARDALTQHEGESDKQFSRRRNRVYIEAMRSFQDDYFVAVGIGTGLLRTGPKRQRLTNADYWQEKDAARARGLATIRGEQLSEETAAKKLEIEDAKRALEIANEQAFKAIMDTSELESGLYSMERAFEKSKAQADSIEYLATRGEALSLEVDDKANALRQLNEELGKAAAEAALVREQIDKQNILLQQQARAYADQQELLHRERVSLSEETKENERRLALRELGIRASERELDALTEGIIAYGGGRLHLSLGNVEKPLRLSGPFDESEKLAERLRPVKPKLVEILVRFDAALQQRTREMQDVLREAMIGWMNGSLRLGKGADGGQDQIIVTDGPASKTLRQKIEPFRDAVVILIAALPEYRLINALKNGISRLGMHLTGAERAEAAQLERTLEELRKRQGLDRD